MDQQLSDALATIRRMREALERIRDFPYVGVKASHAIINIAKAGLSDDAGQELNEKEG